MDHFRGGTPNDVDPSRIGAFKELILQAACRAAGARADFGIIVDDIHGAGILARMTGGPAWIARPVEAPGRVPLVFQHGDDIDAKLRARPRSHVAKCLVSYDPDDPEPHRAAQEASVSRLADACRATGRDLLLEVIPPEDGRDDKVRRAIARFYALGIAPEWWKLPPSPDAEHWSGIEAPVQQHDRHCRGVIVLGLNTPLDTLSATFDTIPRGGLFNGFAVGRSLFWKAAVQWFAGAIDDPAAIDAIAGNIERLIALWDGRGQDHRRVGG